jgi:hypothetical protein
MARHTVVDLSQVFHTTPDFELTTRLDPVSLERLHAVLRNVGLDPDDESGQKLAHFQRMYEPYVDALARYLQMSLPRWVAEPSQKDNWQTTAWDTD